MRNFHRQRCSVPGSMRLPAALGVAATLFGCMAGPDFHRPAEERDTAYRVANARAEEEGASAERAQSLALGKKVSGEWWQAFGSRQLDLVLERAIAGNRNLAGARSTLAQAQALVDQVEGGFYPQVDFSGSVSRSRTNYAGIGRTGTGTNLFVAGPSVSFDLDLFGGRARTAEGQAAIADYAEHQLNAAYLALTADAVTQSIQIASLRAQIEAVDEIIAGDLRKLEAVHKLLDASQATRIDLMSAESQLATDRALLPPLRQQLSAAQHALSLLAGEAPGEWAPPEFKLAEFTLPEEIPVSLPSELVHQRPDILAAEALLHAASASIGVATAQLYPNVSLSAALSQQALSPGTLFSPEAAFWNLASNVTAPIFHGGALTAQKRAAEEAFQASLATYQQTILKSFSQVADLMDALEHDRQGVAAQRRAVEVTSQSAKAARDSFLAGRGQMLQVLDAERLYAQARLGYVRAIAQRYLDTSQFYVSMGGGWQDWQARQRADAKN